MSLFTHPVVATLLQPGMRLMRAMRFPTKMLVMTVVLLVPLTWLTAQAVLNAHEDMALTRAERQGLALLVRMLPVIEHTQKHRGLSNRVAAGDGAARAPLADSARALKLAADAMNTDLLLADDALLQQRWQPIQQVLGRLAAGDQPSDAGEAFRLHSDQIAGLRRLLALSAERSGLLLEPEAAPYHLMDLAVRSTTPWTEWLGQLRGRGAGLLQRGEGTVAERAEMVAQVRQLQDTMASVRQSAEALSRSGEETPAGLTDALRMSQDFAVQALAVAQSTGTTQSPAAYFDAGTAAIGAVLGVGQANAERLQFLLDARHERLQRLWWLALASGIGTILSVAYLTIVFFRTSFGAVRVLQGSVAQLAAGDFATRVRLRGTDELSRVGQSLDSMSGRLSEMISDIRSNSSMVAQAGLRLAEDTKALSERTEAQAASLEQTAASVQEISGAVQRSVEGSETAAGQAARVRGLAEEGGQAIQAAVASMQDIQASSRRVNDIVGVIEGIAFQTNILALNAAVEAARAGEQGRGFAVVAAEVRSLAQRSSSSAREIKALIGTSAGHVETGVAQISGASRTFGDIVAGIRTVADSVDTIHASTTEQSRGLTQIAQAVQHIDEITQRNAQMVESAFHSSGQLSARADRLAAAVASFKLRQGSADEALALVRQAVALHQAHGAAALARITDPSSGLSDRDMYVFAFDRQGIYRAFAGKADKVGTAVRDNPGVDGDKLVRDAFEQAGRGGGWVDYDFANPQTGEVDLKTSYVEPVGPDLVLGCGVYKTRGTGSASVQATPPIARGMRSEQKQAITGPAAAAPLHA